MHTFLENIITDKELAYLKKVFETKEHVLTQGMDKVRIPYDDEEFMQLAKNIIEDKVGITEPYEIVGDNFYKHSHSYFPHCDAVEEKAWLNIVIPLEIYNPTGFQKFIVFDQTWSGNNATWVGNYQVNGDFESNKKISLRPCDSGLFNCGTGQELPENIWNHIDQKYFTKDYFYSMSGTSYIWSPGNIIVFDSNHIHATGKMQSLSKLGLSLRIARK